MAQQTCHRCERAFPQDVMDVTEHGLQCQACTHAVSSDTRYKVAVTEDYASSWIAGNDLFWRLVLLDCSCTECHEKFSNFFLSPKSFRLPRLYVRCPFCDNTLETTFIFRFQRTLGLLVKVLAIAALPAFVVISVLSLFWQSFANAIAQGVCTMVCLAPVLALLVPLVALVVAGVLGGSMDRSRAPVLPEWKKSR